MNSSNFRFSLDLHSLHSQVTIPAFHGDTSITLYITLTDGGVPYYPAVGSLAKITIKRPTGTFLEDFCLIKDNITIVYPFAQNEGTCAVEGINECDITVYAPNGGVVGSPRFSIMVAEKVMKREDIIIEDEDYKIAEAMARAEAERQTAETGRVEAETARADAESARTEAEQERSSEEDARSDAESKRVAAESARVAAEIGRSTAEARRASAEAQREAAEQERVAEMESITDTVLHSDAEAATIGSGAAATVQVSVVGEGKNRKFHFSFGIPEGKQGRQGEQGIQGIQGIQGPQGKPFAIAKIYDSEAAMHADFNNSGIAVGEFVMINTGDVEDEENSRVYVKKETEYGYVTDMSGSKGIQGPQGPQGVPGKDGKDGEDGKSAYDTAKEGGYTGTEAEFAKKMANGSPNTSVTEYGAKGNGTTDDTAAFRNALAANRVVFVPGGTYKLTGGIVIGDNCCLELAQDAVLNFTNTSGNCITLGMLSNLKGNHATVKVPYAFSGNVIHANSTDHTDAELVAVPPFTRWDPQWKSGRYVTDLNICKADSRGFHYSVNGECSGTAVYLSATGSGSGSTFLWGIHFSGLRIAGAFSYGIRAVNYSEGWNHEMRVDAFIDACEVGVSLENCNNAYVSAIVQPRRAYSMADVYSAYAKHGIKLTNSRNTDLSGSRVWDWNAANTLWENGGQYQHVAMYGNCSGTILNDFYYYEMPSYDIRDLIYTDTPSNLEKMTILQEPFTRWFKPKGGEPYFSDGFVEKRLATEEDIAAHFDTDLVKAYADVLATSIDADGSVFKGKGYGRGYVDASGVFHDNDTYLTCTGFIPVKQGQTIYAEGLSFNTNNEECRIVAYKADKTKVWHVNRGLLIGGNSYQAKYTKLDNGFSVRIEGNVTDEVAYVRFNFQTVDVGDYPLMSIDEEIKYTYEGFLADGVKVKAQNVIGLPTGGGGGTSIDVTAQVGQTIVVKEVDASGKPTKWESAEYQPRTHYENGTETKTLLDVSVTVASNQFQSVGFVPIELGKTYTVTWDGTEYECVAFTSNALGAPYPALGNPYFSGGENNGMPFGFISAEDQGGFGGAAMANGTHTIKIAAEVTAYKTIDECYLPNNARSYLLTLPAGSLGENPKLHGYYTVTSVSYDDFAEIVYNGGDVTLDLSNIYPNVEFYGNMRGKLVVSNYVRDGGYALVFVTGSSLDDIGNATLSCMALTFTRGTWTPPTE